VNSPKEHVAKRYKVCSMPWLHLYDLKTFIVLNYICC
jgi:hypothetical protein